jgi:hypothetical protein
VTERTLRGDWPCVARGDWESPKHCSSNAEQRSRSRACRFAARNSRRRNTSTPTPHTDPERCRRDASMRGSVGQPGTGWSRGCQEPRPGGSVPARRPGTSTPSPHQPRLVPVAPQGSPKVGSPLHRSRLGGSRPGGSRMVLGDRCSAGRSGRPEVVAAQGRGSVGRDTLRHRHSRAGDSGR